MFIIALKWFNPMRGDELSHDIEETGLTLGVGEVPSRSGCF